MALTLPCLSRAVCAEQLLTASPKILGGAVPWRLAASTPVRKGAHFSPFCGSRRVSFNNMETATPRALQDMTASRGVSHRFFSSGSAGNFSSAHHDARTLDSVPMRDTTAYFAPFENSSATNLVTATPKALGDMVMAGTTPVGIRADGFCLSEQAESQAEGTSLHSIAEMYFGSLDTEERATTISSSNTSCKDLSSFFTSSGSAHFTPFRAEAHADGMGSATPKSLADMLSSSGRFCLEDREITMPRAPTATHFAPFSEELCLESQGSATPKALADMVMGGCTQASSEAFCLASKSVAGASFSPFRFEDSVPDQGAATPKALAQQYSAQSSGAGFCFGGDTAVAHFMPFMGEADFHGQDTATPKSSAYW